MPTKSSIALVLTLLLAFPVTALAQSAGDDQYTDPFSQDGGGNQGEGGSQGGGGSQGNDGSGGDVQTQDDNALPDTTTPEPQADETGASVVTSSQLPNTGLPIALLVALGASLLMGGLALRRRTS